MPNDILSHSRKVRAIERGNVVRLYLTENSRADLAELSKRTQLPQAQLLSVILRAALEAIPKSGPVSFPMRFKLSNH